MTAIGPSAPCPCRPGSAAGGTSGCGARRTARGTITTGRVCSSGRPTSRSAGITATPSAGSSPHRRRASARSASSIAGPSDPWGGRGDQPLDRGLLRIRLDTRVPVVERVGLQGVHLGPVGQAVLHIRDLEDADPVAPDDRPADPAGREGVDRGFLVRRELVLRDPADRATKGGAIGWVAKYQLASDQEAAINALSAGGISGPIVGSDGIRIFKVTNVQDRLPDGTQVDTLCLLYTSPSPRD